MCVCAASTAGACVDLCGRELRNGDRSVGVGGGGSSLIPEAQSCFAKRQLVELHQLFFDGAATVPTKCSIFSC